MKNLHTSHIASKPKLLAAIIGQAFALEAAMTQVHALPTNPQVVQGEVNLSAQPNTLNIHQASQRAVLEYQQFSIGANEQVIFHQPNAQALTLNKVTGPDASVIAGQLQANGQVFLVNPQGVFFSPSAQVDVSGLVVTTLDIAADDFMSGDFTLMSPGTGKIENHGNIQTDHILAFVSPQIQNTGHLTGDNVHLVSAEQLVIQPRGEHTGLLIDQDVLQTQDGHLLNNGEIQGQWVNLHAAAVDALHNQLIENRGLIKATSLDDLMGGHIRIHSARDTINTGTLDASGTRGGHIEIQAQRAYNNGALLADGEQQGGNISVLTTDMSILDEHSLQSANAAHTGDGGQVINFSDGFSHFNADATITAQGGAFGGNGGFVEVSGIRYVEALGRVSTLAANGVAGSYLIDPTDITISVAADSNGSFTGGGPFNWTPTAATSNINVSTLETNLASNNVTINTASGFAGTGNIDINDSINFDGVGTKSLTLLADGSINMAAGVSISDLTPGGDNLNLSLTAGGNFIMNASSSIDLGSGTLGVTLGGSAQISAIRTLNAGATALVVTAGLSLIHI